MSSEQETAMSQEIEADQAPQSTTEKDVQKEEKAEETSKEPDFCLETIYLSNIVLPFIKEAQNQHGLRHGDYQRYRMYCTRRLRRIRKSLHFTQGHRSRYHKKTISPETVTDVRFLYIPLVSAERAWSLSMELKQAANTEHRKKFHLMRRLQRSVKHANELVQLCEANERCDARTRLEAQAYNSYMVGNVKFEQQKWQEALDAFGQCQTIYEKLGGAVPEEQRALYSQRVDEMVPSIRYCAYNIGDLPSDLSQLMKLRTSAPGSDILSSNIDLVLAKTQEKAASSLTEVTWLGKKVPVKSEKLRVGFVKLQQLEGELSRAESGENKMEVYERLLMECQDTMQLVRDELGIELAVQEKKKTAKAEAQRVSLQSLLHYLTHFKLSHAVRKNLLLIDNMKEMAREGKRNVKPEEFVRVYDILLQHIVELGDIPGLEDNLVAQKEKAARTFAFKAFRCFYLAESYVAMQRWAESIGLFDRAQEHVTEAVEHYRDLEQESADATTKIDGSLLPDLRQLQETIRGKKCEVHVSSLLETQKLEEKMSDLSIASKPLVERMDEFVLTPPSQKVTLAPLPPEYHPIACKPLFFDLALNHIEFPSLEDKMEKKAAGGGITGFMKGLIWGKPSS